jgi:asparagine synthase (glutamine-hydrolysing)
VIPLGSWFRRELKTMTADILFAESDSLLSREYLQTIWKEHQQGSRDRTAHLWSVLMFRQWQKTFQM